MRATPPSRHASTIRIYLRQSKDETTQQSVGKQRSLNDRCIAELRQRGIVNDDMPVEVYTDINCARYDFKRPDFLRFMAETKKADVVVIAWRDRLGDGSRYVVAVEDLVKIAGARLFIADPYEEIVWDKTRGLIEAIHGSQSAAYVEDLKLKVTSTLREQLAEGYAAGNIPFGYTTEPDPSRRKLIGTLERFGKKILIDDERAQLVLRMFAMRAGGPSQKPMGWGAIAVALNAEGLTSPRGGVWCCGTVRQILINTAYICRWSMGKRKGLKARGQRKMVLGDNPTLVKVPERLRIVPQELWERVRAVDEARNRSSRMKEGRPTHALVGVLRCAECGGAMSTSYGQTGPVRERRQTRFYSCSRRRRSGACDAKGCVPADRIEGAIIAEASKILGAFAVAFKRVLHERASSQITARRRDVTRVDGELQAAQERLKKARKIAYASDDDSDETSAHLKRLGDDVKRLERAHASATAEVATAADIERDTLQLVADMQRALEAEPLAARAALDTMFPAGLSLAITADNYDVNGTLQLASTRDIDPDGSNSRVRALKLSLPRRAAA